MGESLKKSKARLFSLADRLDQSIIAAPRGHQFPRHEQFVHDLRNSLNFLVCGCDLGGAHAPTESQMRAAIRKTAIARHGMKTKSAPRRVQH